MRAVMLLFCACASVAAAYYGQPLVRDNPDATLVIATVMTIFAGFLVAIITILGDPVMVPAGSWRLAEARHQNLIDTVIRHTSLFYIYLIAIALLFVGVLLHKASDEAVSESVKVWVERAYLFFGAFSFLLTLGLPHALGKLQIARSEAEIERRRSADGIKPES